MVMVHLGLKELVVGHSRGSNGQIPPRPWGMRWRSSELFIVISVAIGLFVDVVSVTLIVPILPNILHDKLGYPTEEVPSKSGILLAIEGAGLLASTPFFAILGEQGHGRRAVLVLALLGMIAMSLMFMLGRVFWVLVLARVGQGISGSAIWTLGLALLVDTVPEHKVGQIFGYVVLAWTIGALTGPLIGGSLEQASYEAPFIFMICAVALDLGMRLLLIEKHERLMWVDDSNDGQKEISGSEEPDANAAREYESYPTNVWARQKEVLKRFLIAGKSPRLAAALYMTLMIGIMLNGLDATLPQYLKSRFGFSSIILGAIQASPLGFAMIVGPLVGLICDRHGTRYVSVAQVAMITPFVICFGLHLNVAGVVCIYAVIGGLFDGISTAMLTDMAHYVAESYQPEPGKPKPGLALVYSLWNASWSLSALIGPFITSAIYDHQSWFIQNLVLGILLASAIPLLFFFFHNGPMAERKAPGPMSERRASPDNFSAAEKEKRPQDNNTGQHDEDVRPVEDGETGVEIDRRSEAGRLHGDA